MSSRHSVRAPSGAWRHSGVLRPKGSGLGVSVNDDPDPVEVLHPCERVIRVGLPLDGDAHDREASARLGEPVRRLQVLHHWVFVAVAVGYVPVPSKSHSTFTILPVPGGTPAATENSISSPTPASLRSRDPSTDSSTNGWIPLRCGCTPCCGRVMARGPGVFYLPSAALDTCAHSAHSARRCW